MRPDAMSVSREDTAGGLQFRCDLGFGDALLVATPDEVVRLHGAGYVSRVPTAALSAATPDFDRPLSASLRWQSGDWSLFEFAPARHWLWFRRERRQFPLPWLYFLEGPPPWHPLYVFVSPEALATVRDPVYQLPLPNVHPNGFVCQYTGPERSAPPIDTFFNQSFNHDWYTYEALPAPLQVVDDTTPGDLAGWARAVNARYSPEACCAFAWSPCRRDPDGGDPDDESVPIDEDELALFDAPLTIPAIVGDYQGDWWRQRVRELSSPTVTVDTVKPHTTYSL